MLILTKEQRFEKWKAEHPQEYAKLIKLNARFEKAERLEKERALRKEERLQKRLGRLRAIRNLRDEGYTYAQIAHELGVTKQAIQRYVQKYEVEAERKLYAK